METQPLIVIVGETGAGKTALAIALAKKFGGEIVSADSWAVYKGFDIGTAKPTKKEQKQAKFHLIDVTTAQKGFSAAVFKRLATAAIADIEERGKLAILVGGTGLYVDSILYDYSFMEAGEPEYRRELNALSLDQLLERAKANNISTAGIDTRNKRRLVRLIEANGERPKRSGLRPNTFVVGLEIPGSELKNRIEKRVDEMLKRGLEKEVKKLAKGYGWDNEPMRGIGYREWHGYFDCELSLDEVRTKIITSTGQLAKKQRTWFKRNKSIHWVQQQREAVELLTTLLNKNSISE